LKIYIIITATNRRFYGKKDFIPIKR